MVRIDRVTGETTLEKDERLISAPPYLQKKYKGLLFLLVRVPTEAENSHSLPRLYPWRRNVERR